MRRYLKKHLDEAKTENKRQVNEDFQWGPQP
jgi:hypothetical protein